MQLRIFLLSAPLLAAFMTVNAQNTQPRNEIEVRGAFAIPSGEASFSSNGDEGTVIDFSRDFDLKTEFGFLVRFTHRTENGKHKLLGEYGQTKWNRTTSLSRSFTFLGQTYVANLDASADLRLRDFRVMYAYRWGDDKIRIGPMVDMGIVSTKLDLTGTTNNGTRSDSGKITKFAATIGYDLDYDPTPQVNIFHNLGAIAFQGERLFHTEGGVKFFVTRQFGVSAGYKALRYRVEKNDNFILVRAHGPFFGGVFRF
ncbi:MAG TPA: hypothetical protein VFB70_19390 [Pyrinomonadaceae bacterium]|jgi:hypothetical protein|nr:hypothetical protein [Pyrinomonadaceae bacterium]